jgi:hypothetical protein
MERGSKAARLNARFLRNNGKDQGYLVYGLPTPKSAAGIEFSGSGVGSVIAGDTPPTFQGGETTAQTTAIQIANATSRLADMQVISGNSFSVRLATQAVTLSGGYRDRSADGDTAIVAQVLLAELRFQTPAESGITDGVITFSALTSEDSALDTNTATWYRLFQSDGTTAIMDGDVSTSGADLNLNNTSIATSQTVSVTAFTVTEGNG